MNPLLARLQPYPFQRLRECFADLTPHPEFTPVNLSIGEPKHPTPALLKDALAGALEGLGEYPATLGGLPLREACAGWVASRYQVDKPDPARQILPVLGSREALFSLAQAVVDASHGTPVVVSPNPFYQIYEGAALLAGAEPYYVNCTAENGFKPDWSSVPAEVWARTQLVYACSPGNPTGAVMTLEDWRLLFELSDRYGFVIASDECYSEIWFDAPPLGGLEAAARLGRGDYRNLVMFTSLSKRSNAPGLRSGFVCGDAEVLAKFLLYRTYHGSAMSAVVQAASRAAWQDEAHVADNRQRYADKFAAVLPIVGKALDVGLPQAGFYLWARVPGGDDIAFARDLFARYHVTVLPGSFLARTAHGVNPGAGYVRIALVAPLEACVEAAWRVVDCVRTRN
ncbi:succinyldiaminopimelate transaminase [Laribacter hongkongensis]|uniref:Putative 8-amino-7-oxononanoate synthase n=1 Tax=Laribacter hongkongensis TaxID=168471 RepID=A0ABD4SLJ5_9NEIS|nr:succinyldiaminopimelate transaminase [Laribacter hongkongensis]MCG9024591.1 succinyldiaminopimelate transaminase [Laribacter hongkongensis]MCG9099625.1 succinyldiaminopimelate transaminase [Laribacter hongkongensis]MCG9103921.1 succinyldiaminopimelate transaminase [Laribacter hongkongensis]MCG9111592.1 succinyldiaminopimelate transaminase [Laribacter hongkongensis]MCG9117158.1 succinyldiaminopimelate transaminase [Laribacter hongkongensis]